MDLGERAGSVAGGMTERSRRRKKCKRVVISGRRLKRKIMKMRISKNKTRKQKQNVLKGTVCLKSQISTALRVPRRRGIENKFN